MLVQRNVMGMGLRRDGIANDVVPPLFSLDTRPCADPDHEVHPALKLAQPLTLHVINPGATSL